jgi:hypothetical protein
MFLGGRCLANGTWKLTAATCYICGAVLGEEEQVVLVVLAPCLEDVAPLTCVLKALWAAALFNSNFENHTWAVRSMLA